MRSFGRHCFLLLLLRTKNSKETKKRNIFFFEEYSNNEIVWESSDNMNLPASQFIHFVFFVRSNFRDIISIARTSFRLCAHVQSERISHTEFPNYILIFSSMHKTYFGPSTSHVGCNIAQSTTCDWRRCRRYRCLTHSFFQRPLLDRFVVFLLRTHTLTVHLNGVVGSRWVVAVATSDWQWKRECYFPTPLCADKKNATERA